MVVINNKKTAGRQRISTRKTALFGLLTALAVVLGYVESLIPVYLGAPGVKLGLANLVTMIALYCMGVRAAIVINLVRIFFWFHIRPCFGHPVQPGRSRLKPDCHGGM